MFDIHQTYAFPLMFCDMYQTVMSARKWLNANTSCFAIKYIIYINIVLS